jgi:hypothetical protein
MKRAVKRPATLLATSTTNQLTQKDYLSTRPIRTTSHLGIQTANQKVMALILGITTLVSQHNFGRLSYPAWYGILAGLRAPLLDVHPSWLATCLKIQGPIWVRDLTSRIRLQATRSLIHPHLKLLQKVGSKPWGDPATEYYRALSCFTST